MDQEPVIGLDLGVTTPSELAVATGARIESTRRVASTPKGLIAGLRGAAKGRAVAIVVESTAMAWFLAAVAAARAGITHSVYRVSGSKAAALRGFYRAHTKTDHIDARVLPGCRRWTRGCGASPCLSPPNWPCAAWWCCATSSSPRRPGSKTGSAPPCTGPPRGWSRQREDRSPPGWWPCSGGGPTCEHWLGPVPPQSPGRGRGPRSGPRRCGPQRPKRWGSTTGMSTSPTSPWNWTSRWPTWGPWMPSGPAWRAGSPGCTSSSTLTTTCSPSPGIGPVVAGVIRAILGTGHRFASLAALKAFTGLVPREDSSGEARRRGRISKAGPSVLRWALYLAADTARQWDPALADLYRRLMVERGRTHTQALCAVASHLLGRIWAVVRENRPSKWRDLDGNPISRQQARALALSLRIDPETRARRRARNKGGPAVPRTRQPQAPHDIHRPSGDELIKMALEVVART
jgi:Transposase IS116/IS110/IS902 family/Transposase